MKDVIVIHHTGICIRPQIRAVLTPIPDCGYTHNSDEALKSTLKAKLPDHAHDIDQLEFGTFGSGSIERYVPSSSSKELVEHTNYTADPLTLWIRRLEETVREDLGFLKAQPLVRQALKDNAKGYIWDIKTGKLSPVSFDG